MSETVAANPSKPWFALVALHASQLILASGVLSLALYGVQYFAYNVLIYTIVASLCTILVCAYLMTSHTYLKRIYSPYVAAAYHLWMLLFWVVDLGLLAHLARLWISPECLYKYRNGFTCAPYSKRNGRMRYDTFYRVLVAGAVLAACEFNSGTGASNSMEEIQLRPILNHGVGTITTIAPPAANSAWEHPDAEGVRPGPQPLIGDDEHGFSRDGTGAGMPSLGESYTRSIPPTVLLEEEQSHPGTVPICPLVPTNQVKNGKFRITNATQDDAIFTIGE
ncbi:hypothetical protein FB567DRAFT_595958 [Paraphoma chrysanthemicola]|uniref:MARVEL domain-containing protein n=1 Tax=Paraphoma chrysanthemicola TaxID=798071 RepID=A0A8K0QZY8_9PLEO|nr:hypothetical protein FB567DRAFT_595958 [Paraphoma chrysanthemicola]